MVPKVLVVALKVFVVPKVPGAPKEIGAPRVSQKRITASSQPRDSADPCVIRSRIAAPKEEGPGSAQRGGGKAKYHAWSDAGDNSTMHR